MNWVLFAAIAFVVWWLSFFIVLPFGVKSQAEHEDGFLMGTAESAPVRPRLLAKAIAATILAAVIVGLLYAANAVFGLDLESVSHMFDV